MSECDVTFDGHSYLNALIPIHDNDKSCRNILIFCAFCITTSTSEIEYFETVQTYVQNSYAYIL